MVAETKAEPRQLALPGLGPPLTEPDLLPCEGCGSPMERPSKQQGTPAWKEHPEDRYLRCGACGMECWVTQEDGVQWFDAAPGVGARW